MQDSLVSVLSLLSGGSLISAPALTLTLSTQLLFELFELHDRWRPIFFHSLSPTALDKHYFVVSDVLCICVMLFIFISDDLLFYSKTFGTLPAS
jgi:hypothetical protein